MSLKKKNASGLFSVYFASLRVFLLNGTKSKMTTNVACDSYYNFSHSYLTFFFYWTRILFKLLRVLCWILLAEKKIITMVLIDGGSLMKFLLILVYNGISCLFHWWILVHGVDVEGKKVGNWKVCGFWENKEMLEWSLYTQCLRYFLRKRKYPKLRNKHNDLYSDGMNKKVLKI